MARGRLIICWLCPPASGRYSALVGKALGNSQIASRLSLKEATVKRHLRNVFVKLGAVSRTDAVNKAAELEAFPRPPQGIARVLRR